MNSFGLNEDFSEEEKAIVFNKTNEIITKRDLKNIDKNLDEDRLKIEGQNFVVASFVGPALTAKTENYGIRIMGVFSNEDSALEHIEVLKENPEAKMYDTCIIEMYKFVPSYPHLDPNMTLDKSDKYLNDIIVRYKTNQVASSLFYDLRKNKLKKNKERYVEDAKSPEEIEAITREYRDSIEKENEAIKQSAEIKVNEEVQKNARNATHARLIEKMNKKKEEALKVSLEKKKEAVPRKALNMRASDIKCDNYNFVALICVKDPSADPDSSERIPVKFRGFFSTEQECREYIVELMEIDDTYDIICTPMYVWVPCNPDTSKIESEYQEEELNTLNKGHKKETKSVNKYRFEREKELILEEDSKTITATETLMKLAGANEETFRESKSNTNNSGEGQIKFPGQF